MRSTQVQKPIQNTKRNAPLHCIHLCSIQDYTEDKTIMTSQLSNKKKYWLAQDLLSQPNNKTSLPSQEPPPVIPVSNLQHIPTSKGGRKTHIYLTLR
jgi:hypothetical protein